MTRLRKLKREWHSLYNEYRSNGWNFKNQPEKLKRFDSLSKIMNQATKKELF